MNKETFNEFCNNIGGCEKCEENDGKCIDVWNHQQTKLGQKDARIKELEEDLRIVTNTDWDLYRYHENLNQKYRMQLKEANEVIDFYGNPNGSRVYGCVTYTMHLDDISTINDAGWILKLRGKKAREYQAKYKGE